MAPIDGGVISSNTATISLITENEKSGGKNLGEDNVVRPTEIHSNLGEGEVVRPTEVHSILSEGEVARPTEVHSILSEGEVVRHTGDHSILGEDEVVRPTEIHPIPVNDEGGECSTRPKRRRMVQDSDGDLDNEDPEEVIDFPVVPLKQDIKEREDELLRQLQKIEYRRSNEHTIKKYKYFQEKWKASLLFLLLQFF